MYNGRGGAPIFSHVSFTDNTDMVDSCPSDGLGNDLTQNFMDYTGKLFYCLSRVLFLQHNYPVFRRLVYGFIHGGPDSASTGRMGCISR